ncbi:hypothetical protein GQ53DRAFT_753597 [Thozetella sp. PMI_491]|nr:hypothetical protein GQ53DRAFT_753597 [Thozetella sp. PMI_491]
MGIKTFILAAATAQIASAHFALEYPQWRANSLAAGSNYSQWIYPCANVNPGAGNRTDWPINGGSLVLDLHHPWTYVFVNLGLGDNVTNFNYTLTPSFWNETGNGTLCVPSLPLPVGLTPADGSHGSIQVVTLGESGAALYNCADITFRSNVSALSGDACKTDTGVSYSVVNQQVNGTTVGGSNSSSNGTSSGTGKNAGSTAGVNMVALTSVVALALVFVAGGM